MTTPPMEAALADLRFQIVLAKLFGEKMVQSDEGYTLTAFAWRGRVYVVDVTKDLTAPPIPPRTS